MAKQSYGTILPLATRSILQSCVSYFGFSRVQYHLAEGLPRASKTNLARAEALLGFAVASPEHLYIKSNREALINVADFLENLRKNELASEVLAEEAAEYIPLVAPPPCTALATQPKEASKVFQFQGINLKTLVTETGDILFRGPDVCKALEIAHAPTAYSKLEEDQKVSFDESAAVVLNNSGKISQKVTYLTESGMYELIMNSRKPEARVFRKWVTSEVLPTLRKTGRYDLTAPKISSDPMEVALQAAMDSHRANKALLQLKADLDANKACQETLQGEVQGLRNEFQELQHQPRRLEDAEIKTLIQMRINNHCNLRSEGWAKLYYAFSEKYNYDFESKAEDLGVEFKKNNWKWDVLVLDRKTVLLLNLAAKLFPNM